MDVNSRINWMPGMEITAQTFIGLSERWDYKQQLALQTALGGNRTGLIPQAPFRCKAMFVNNQLEVEGLLCMALLPSGRIVNADEDVQVPIPMLFGSEYYFTIGFDNSQTEFEKEGVPFVRPRYTYAFYTREEVEHNDVFPLLRFHVEDGVFSISQDFIPPCLQLTDNERIKSYIDLFIGHLTTITAHQNLAEGEGKRALLHYLFRLKSLNMGISLNDFMLFTHEIAHAVNYHIITPNRDQPTPIPNPSLIDIQEWLQWLCDYLTGAVVVLDGVVLEDNTIDYDALLAQAKKELYEQLQPELTAKILEVIRQEIHTEIQQLREDLTSYLNDTLKPEMKQELTAIVNEQSTRLQDIIFKKFDDLNEKLKKSLYERLYTELFENLFNALYVPEPEDRKSLPLI